MGIFQYKIGINYPMLTFAEKVIAFNQALDFQGVLPNGIQIMNPFRENEQIPQISAEFYRKYYNDFEVRHLILGINPGRFGAGLTGIPFTDPKRLMEKCQIAYEGKITHEPSSVFVYEMIAEFGGMEAFYQKFYIHSICPLGFTKTNEKGKEINYNYYDNQELTDAVYDFILENIQKQIDLGIKTDLVFCFGTGKNEHFLKKLNAKYHFFDRIIALEHPRFIMQYKSKSKTEYIKKYLKAFSEAKLND